MLEDFLQTYVIPALFRVLFAFLIWIAGRWSARRVRVLVEHSLARTELTESFVTLITTLSYYAIWILTFVLMLSVVGVPTTAIVTIVGVVVVILAISFQASLANFASTIIFLLFKPFKVGDLIESGGVLGLVQEIQMFSTVIVAPDGKVHIIPNAKIQGAGITNFSKTGRLRLGLSFSIAYDSDIDQAKKILMDIISNNDQVLSEPPPRAFVQQLGDSSIDLVTWTYVLVEDYLTLHTELNEKVKKAFDAAGITIPFPQQDVHLINES
jgi:small conductance mechanosensitive channel